MHDVLSVMQVCKPKDFAMQINLHMENCWGIVRAVIDLCLKLDEGKYIIVKEPNKPVMRLYSVPENAFEQVGLCMHSHLCCDMTTDRLHASLLLLSAPISPHLSLGLHAVQQKCDNFLHLRTNYAYPAAEDLLVSCCIPETF